MCGNFNDAIRPLGVVICPKCGDTDPHTAALTLQPEQNGTLSCTNCGHNFKPVRAELKG